MATFPGTEAEIAALALVVRDRRFLVWGGACLSTQPYRPRLIASFDGHPPRSSRIILAARPKSTTPRSFFTVPG